MRRVTALLSAILLLPVLALAQPTPTATPTAAYNFPDNPIVGMTATGPSGQTMKWDGTKWVAQFLGGAGIGGPPFVPAGDLAGSTSSQVVVGVQAKPVPVPASGYLHYNGTAFLWDTPTGGSGGGGISEAPTDGNAYLRANSSWTSGGTIANDIIVSAVHLTNLSGWAPLNFGNPTLTAGTSGAVTASLFAYNGGAGGNNNLNITAGSHMWNGNWVSDTPTAESIVMNPTTIGFQYSTGNTVGATLGSWRTIADFDSTGLTLPSATGTIVINDTSRSSILWGSPTAPTGSILGFQTSDFDFAASARYDGTTWVSSGTAAIILSLNGAGGLTVFQNTGLTAGASYSPTTIATITKTGINLPTGSNFTINGVAIGGGNFLPLTGGTLSGPGNLTVNGVLTQNGNAQFGGGATVSFGLSVPNWMSVNGNATFNGPVAFNSTVSGLSFAPLTNPTNGQNNYAPLASPTFTGTVRMPDASTVTTAGYNNMKGIGIGTTATAGNIFAFDNTNTQQYAIVYNNNAGSGAAGEMSVGSNDGNQATFAETSTTFDFNTSGTQPFYTPSTTVLDGNLSNLNIGVAAGYTTSLYVSNMQVANFSTTGINLPVAGTNYWIHGINRGLFATGTWTPDLQFGGSNAGMAYSARAGIWTWSGQSATLEFNLHLSAKGTGAGYATVSGFPANLAINNTSQAVGSCFTQGGIAGLQAGDVLYIQGAFDGSAVMYPGATRPFQDQYAVWTLGDYSFTDHTDLECSITWVTAQ